LTRKIAEEERLAVLTTILKIGKNGAILAERQWGHCTRED